MSESNNDDDSEPRGGDTGDSGEDSSPQQAQTEDSSPQQTQSEGTSQESKSEESSLTLGYPGGGTGVTYTPGGNNFGVYAGQGFHGGEQITGGVVYTTDDGSHGISAGPTFNHQHAGVQAGWTWRFDK